MKVTIAKEHTKLLRLRMRRQFYVTSCHAQITSVLSQSVPFCVPVWNDVKLMIEVCSKFSAAGRVAGTHTEAMDHQLVSVPWATSLFQIWVTYSFVSLSLVLCQIRICKNRDMDIAIIWPQIFQHIFSSTVFTVNRKPRLHNTRIHKLDLLNARLSSTLLEANYFS